MFRKWGGGDTTSPVSSFNNNRTASSKTQLESLECLVWEKMQYAFSFLIQFSIFLLATAGFDWNFGYLALFHSENTYCDPNSYLTRNYWGGHLDGFVPTYHIYDHSTDTQGYIGYTPSQNTIYVAFRGSTSIENWVTNLDFATVKYPTCSNCYVHQGFYNAEQKIIGQTIDHVRYLKSQFPWYSVLVAGHSLGGALATLAAVDLQAAGVGDVRLFNFGSPRVGDMTFAAWVSSFIRDHNRVTHYKDEVPHVPSSGTVQHFTHISGEFFQHDRYDLDLWQCNGYEDPNCAYQYNAITSGSIDDHMSYLGVTLGSGGCGDVKLFTNSTNGTAPDGATTDAGADANATAVAGSSPSAKSDPTAVAHPEPQSLAATATATTTPAAAAVVTSGGLRGRAGQLERAAGAGLWTELTANKKID